MNDKLKITNTTAEARMFAAGALDALRNLLADGKVDYVSGGLVINPPNANGEVVIASDLVLRVPRNLRVH